MVLKVAMASRKEVLGYTLAGAAAGCLLSAVVFRRRQDTSQGSTRRHESPENTRLRLLLPEEQLEPKEFDVPNADLRLLRKAETVLRRRTGKLLIVLERLQDGHNYCAVLRTMEALGVQHVWVVSPPTLESKNIIRRQQAEEMTKTATTTRVRKRAQERLNNLWEADMKEDLLHSAFGKNAQRWLSVREFASTEECLEALRADDRQVWVTALEQRAQVLTPGAAWLQEPDALPEKVAVVLGAEEAGVSDKFKKAADRLVYLPLCGFAESLNVSVAAALISMILLQLYAQTRLPEDMRLDAAEMQSLREDWYAKLARTADESDTYANLTQAPPAPLDDLRRPDAHRVARFHSHRRDA